MRKVLAVVLVIALSGCSMVRNLGGGTAQENAAQALVTTTRTCVLLMTAAGIAYDAGAFGEPGSARAEDVWSKISAESLRMNSALNAWTEAIRANKDAGAFQSMVSQALAVIAALLPARPSAFLVPVTDGPVSISLLANPDSFRRRGFAGGAL